MKEDLNELIEINLPLIAKKGHLMITEFKNLKQNFYEWEQFANNLVEKNLGKLNQERFEISEHGLEIVKNGGWLKYLEVEKEKKELETKRTNRKDKSDEIDLNKKTWEYRNRKLPYYFSALALIGTITSILISYKSLKKKHDSSELKQMQQQIHELQDNVKRIDTFNLLNIQRKK